MARNRLMYTQEVLEALDILVKEEGDRIRNQILKVREFEALYEVGYICIYNTDGRNYRKFNVKTVSDLQKAIKSVDDHRGYISIFGEDGGDCHIHQISVEKEISATTVVSMTINVIVE